MADEKMNLQAEEAAAEAEVETTEAADAKPAKAEKRKGEKKENFFVRFGKKIKKLLRDLGSEMKKVVWTPKAEVSKNSKLVIATVVIVALIIAVIDFSSSWIINSVAGLIG